MFKKTQQKLSEELKNIPADTSLVCSTISSGLNKPERVSVQDKVLNDNIPEENKPQHTEGLTAKVYVKNKNGNSSPPLRMGSPCHI